MSTSTDDIVDGVRLVFADLRHAPLSHIYIDSLVSLASLTDSIQLEPRDAHLHVRNGKVPLTLKGAVVSVPWRMEDSEEGARVILWVAPPPLKGPKGASTSTKRAGDSTAKLVGLAKSLAGNYRKRLPAPTCSVLDNAAVLRAVPKVKIVNRSLPVCSVVT